MHECALIEDFGLARQYKNYPTRIKGNSGSTAILCVPRYAEGCDLEGMA